MTIGARSEYYESDSKHRAARAIAVGVLWSFWALSVVPFIVLLVEFNEPPRPCDQLDAWYYAKLYGHIFVYPLFFGFAATVFLSRPLADTVCLIREQKAPGRGWIIAFLACSIVGIVSFASQTEFTRTTAALFSFKAAAEDLPEQANDATQVVHEACQALTEKHIRPAESGNGAEHQREEKPLDDVTGNLNTPRSKTGWAFYVGFVGNTTWVALLFGVVVVRTGLGQPSQLALVFAAIVLASFWVPFRIAYLVEKAELYSNADLQAVDYPIFIAFSSLYVCAAWLLCTKEFETQRLQQVVSWGGSIVVLIVNVLTVLVNKDILKMQDSLTQLFGLESSMRHYFIMLILFFVLAASMLIKGMVRGDSKEAGVGDER